MAYFVRVVGHARSDGRASFTMEPPWWDRRELQELVDFREQISHGYLDHQAELSVERTRELHDHFRPHATSGGYAYEGWQNLIRPMLRDLDDVLGPRAHEFSHFRIEIMEWESGLG